MLPGLAGLDDGERRLLGGVLRQALMDLNVPGESADAEQYLRDEELDSLTSAATICHLLAIDRPLLLRLLATTGLKIDHAANPRGKVWVGFSSAVRPMDACPICGAETGPRRLYCSGSHRRAAEKQAIRKRRLSGSPLGRAA